MLDVDEDVPKKVDASDGGWIFFIEQFKISVRKHHYFFANLF